MIWIPFQAWPFFLNGSEVRIEAFCLGLQEFVYSLGFNSSVSMTTSATGTVAQTQEFDPWGAVKAGGITSVSYNYTGQRLDGTGLLFYNARYYDPQLARFTSADTIISSSKDPQTRNRYAYVLNNPLKYNDPTGNVAEDYKKESTSPNIEEVWIKGALAIYGIKLVDHPNAKAWELAEMRAVLQTVRDIQKVTGWSLLEFVTAMGNVDIIKAGKVDGVYGAATEGKSIMLFADAFGSPLQSQLKMTLAHEFAHILDQRTGYGISAGLLEATGGTQGNCSQLEDCYTEQGQTASNYAKTHVTEDWAESFAATIYPNGPGVNWQKMSNSRKIYVNDVISVVDSWY